MSTDFNEGSLSYFHSSDSSRRSPGPLHNPCLLSGTPVCLQAVPPLESSACVRGLGSRVSTFFSQAVNCWEQGGRAAVVSTGSTAALHTHGVRREKVLEAGHSWPFVSSSSFSAPRHRSNVWPRAITASRCITTPASYVTLYASPRSSPLSSVLHLFCSCSLSLSHSLLLSLSFALSLSRSLSLSVSLFLSVTLSLFIFLLLYLSISLSFSLSLCQCHCCSLSLSLSRSLFLFPCSLLHSLPSPSL